MNATRVVLTLTAVLLSACSNPITRVPATSSQDSTYSPFTPSGQAQTQQTPTQDQSLQNGSNGQYVSSLLTDMNQPASSQAQVQKAVYYLGNIISAMAGYIQQMKAVLDSTGEKAARNGSFVTRWGNGGLPADVPAGSELIYSGYAFGSAYADKNVAKYYDRSQKEFECLKGGDRGDTVSAESSYGGVYYPVITGAAARLPRAVPTTEFIACNVFFVPSATLVLKGSSSCPSNMKTLYSGYLMSGYWNDPGASTNSICVDDKNFDQSRSPNDGPTYSYVYGSHTKDTQLGGDFPSFSWIKCAVCAR